MNDARGLRGENLMPQRKRYRSWLLLPNPTPPRATIQRYNRGAAQAENFHHENVVQPADKIEHAGLIVEGVAENVMDNLAEEHCVNPATSDSEHSNVSERSLQDFSDSGSHTSSASESEAGSSDEDSSEHDAENIEAGGNDGNNNNNIGTEDGNENVNEDGNVRVWDVVGDDRWREQLPNGIPCTKFECLLMVMNFTFRHGLTQVATEDLCKMINTILGGNYIPTSKFMFHQIFGNCTFRFHFFCKTCLVLLGNIKNTDSREVTYHCQVCDSDCNVQQSMNDGNFFVTFPIKEQLRFLMESHNDMEEMLKYRCQRTADPNCISDIMDGNIYKELSKEGGFLADLKNLSLTMFTDGAQVFESGVNTLWPIQFRVNELPLGVRYDKANTMISGLWFANTEPNMSLYLSTFVDEINSLSNEGFTWKNNRGEIIRSKVNLLNCAADSKARPLVQSTKMHNGNWGCSFCHHPGVIYDGNMQAKYPMCDELFLNQDFSFEYRVNGKEIKTKDPQSKVFHVEDRDDFNIRRDMESVEELRAQGNLKAEIKGVKCTSPLARLLHFNLVFGFVICYMHSVLLGVVKHVTDIWLESSKDKKGKTYYIRKRIPDIDKRLLSIKPPKEISRRPQSIDKRCHWKANEWRAWLFYYSLPCLQGILPEPYYKHHCMLVSAIYTLCQEKITFAELRSATWLLGRYCVEFGKLYSPQDMFYNVHLLLHLGKCVYMSGALFHYSGFPFEGMNGTVVQLVKGSRGVLFQIAEKYTRMKILPRVVELYHVSDNVFKYCENLQCFSLSKNSETFGGIRLLGLPRSFTLSEEEFAAIASSGHNITRLSYERLIIHKTRFDAMCYRRKGKKSNNSIVHLRTGMFGVLQRILPLNCFRGDGDPCIMIILKEINIEGNKFICTSPYDGGNAKHIRCCPPIIYGDLVVIKATEIVEKAMILESNGKTFLTVFPNKIEKD